MVARAEGAAKDDRASARSSTSVANDWLVRLVREDGFVHFGVDPRARRVDPVGLMHHGRAAVVVRALGLAGGGEYAEDASRARAWLERDVRSALRGEVVAGWPAERERAAGTIALACLAGLPLAEELARFVGDDPFTRSPWHAAQIVAALGPAAPARLWETCTASLAATPWAPWTAIGAHARDDRATLARAAATLERSIREGGPHEGGAGVTEIPELALTALTIEALAPLRRSSSSARAAVTRAQRFLTPLAAPARSASRARSTRTSPRGRFLDLTPSCLPCARRRDGALHSWRSRFEPPERLIARLSPL